MAGSNSFEIRQLGPDDVVLMDGLLATFGEAFHEPQTYGANRPSAGYLERLLGDSGIRSALRYRSRRVGELTPRRGV